MLAIPLPLQTQRLVNRSIKIVTTMTAVASTALSQISLIPSSLRSPISHHLFSHLARARRAPGAGRAGGPLEAEASVGALFDSFFPDDEEVDTSYYVFVEEEGRWKIDGRVLGVDEQYPP